MQDLPGARAEPPAVPLLVPAGGGLRGRRRLGFYFQVECSAWANQGASDRAGGPLDAWLYAEAERILRAYGNHPSFCLLSLRQRAGRASRKAVPGASWVDHFKAEDPRRLYTAGCGLADHPREPVPHHARPAHPGLGRRPAEPHQRPAAGDDDRLPRLHRQVRRTPIVSHEIGQWCVYPNFDEIKKYTGVSRAYNFEIFRDLLAAQPHARPGARFLMASGKLQALLLQGGDRVGPAHARLRRVPAAGPARLSRARARRWSACSIRSGTRRATSRPRSTAASATATVPLARLEKRILDRATRRSRPTSTSPTSARRAARRRSSTGARCSMHDGQRGRLGHASRRRTIPPGNASTRSGTVAVAARSGSSSAPAEARLGVAVAGTRYENDWDFWVYPRQVDTARAADVLVADAAGRRGAGRLEGGRQGAAGRLPAKA